MKTCEQPRLSSAGKQSTAMSRRHVGAARRNIRARGAGGVAHDQGAHDPRGRAHGHGRRHKGSGRGRQGRGRGHGGSVHARLAVRQAAASGTSVGDASS